MNELFGVLNTILQLQLEEHRQEIERIRNKQASDHYKTVYFYDESQAPMGYVKLSGVITSRYMLRRYGMKVYRNAKKPVYVLPKIINILGKEYLEYMVYSPIPEREQSVIPITKRT